VGSWPRWLELWQSWAYAAGFVASVYTTAAAQQPPTEFVPSYTAGIKDAAGRFMGGTEMRGLGLPWGPSHDWECGGQLGIFAFVFWPRVDAWLGW